ncbi:MAG: hypothetical protein LIO53_02970, partial [Oscillospiraceae bacterium]|nr:hypothetical protein [Oscillospiraceae bacterium]
MADISSLLNTIKTAIYGKDMRSAIHDSIENVNEALEDHEKNVTASASTLGHVKLSDSMSNTDNVSNGIAATPAAVKAAKDSALESINAEMSERKAADTTLQANIDSEAAAREAADAELQTNLNAEISARETADTALQKQIDAIEIE